MTQETEKLSAELQPQLRELNNQSRSMMPAEVAATLQQATEDLVRSGIAERSLKEGAKAPDFVLPNVKGDPVHLSDLLARGAVVLTFYRGGWWPYCNLQLQAYQKVLPEIEALGASLVAVSPQTPDNSLTTAEKNDIKFEALSDRGNQVARQFGLVFPLADAVRPLYKGFGIDLPAVNADDSYELPMPGTFIIAEDRTIRLAFVDADYTRRLEPSEILNSLRELKREEASKSWCRKLLKAMRAESYGMKAGLCMSLKYLKEAISNNDSEKLIRYVRLHLGDGDEAAGRRRMDWDFQQEVRMTALI